MLALLCVRALLLLRLRSTVIFVVFVDVIALGAGPRSFRVLPASHKPIAAHRGSQIEALVEGSIEVLSCASSLVCGCVCSLLSLFLLFQLSSSSVMEVRHFSI